MTKKNTLPATLSAPELQLIERLRKHPELLERFQSILEISANAEGPVESSVAMLHLTAALGSGPPLAGGLRWRIFSARAEADGTHSLVAESNLAQPTVALPPGDYVLQVVVTDKIAKATATQWSDFEVKDPGPAAH